MVTALTQVWVLLWKDVLIDLRRKENIVSMFFFALLTLLIFNFAIGGGEAQRYRLTPRVLGVLAGQGLAPAQVQALLPLLGRTFNDRAALLAALDALPAGPAPAPVRIAVLEQSARGFLQEGAAGLLWVTMLLAGVLGLSRSFAQEREQGCMDGLLLTPVSRGVLYLGKMLSNTLFLTVILALLLPLFSLFMGVGLRGAWPALVAVLLGGTLGFAALGTLLGGITASLKGREVLLPILLFPLLVPLVVVVVHLSVVILEGEPLAAELRWLELLAAFDAVFLIVSYLVFEYVMES
jgi:heme exporter protein B